MMKCKSAFLLVLVLSSVSLAGPADTVSVNDGPYVIWQDSGRAIVFWICNGELVTKSYEKLDTLIIESGCEETGQTLRVPAALSAIEPDSFLNVQRIFAVSDIHGEYEALTHLLQVAGLVDSNLAWTWGEGHLVVCGDGFDRGDKVTETLWLLYRLEQEAGKAGGGVHYVLGNHEKLALGGTSGDVNKKYRDATAKKSRVLTQDLFGPDTELGQWLRSKNSVVKLNDILFVHGGLSPQLAGRGLTLPAINRKVRDYYDLRSTQVAFRDEPGFLFGTFGPFWYRGYFMSREGEYPQAAQSDVERVLVSFAASAVAVGHTENDRVDCYYDCLVFGLDVPINGPESLQGLLWENGSFYRVTGTGARELLK